MKNTTLFWAVLFSLPFIGYADSIMVDGKHLTDVLVYESEKYYYVKLPREGRSLSISKKEVDSTTVQINEDPFYRDDLRALYDDVKLRGEAALGDGKPKDNAFKVEPGAESQGIDTAALLAGGGGGAAGGGSALSISLEEVKSSFSALQVTFTKGGPGWKGQSSDGTVTATLATQGDKVTTIQGNINATDPSAITQKAFGLIQMIAKVAPWSQAWVMQNQATLMNGGSIDKTEGGVAISISVSANGLGFTVRGA